mmetsp:Transcript_4825/g.4481  ORF Transcript_4825/g.4481 Transcript_4825/m.4481 type:complete len:86 (+) Transcript_4825:265-522(+)
MLKEKYEPLFTEMQETLSDKRLEYMTFLTKKLNQNKERILLEKEVFSKLMDSCEPISGKIKEQLEHQQVLIKKQEEIQKKIVEEY